MTERQGTVRGRTDQSPDDSGWSIEGAESYGDGGLGDTVVRLPRIPADGPPPELPTPPKVRPPRNSGAKKNAASEETTIVKPAAPAAPAAREDHHSSPFAEPSGPGMAPPAMPPAAAPTAFAVPAAAATSVTAPVAAPATKPKASGLRRTRKARLRLAKVDPWSVMKTSFLFSIAFGIMFWVSVSVVWTVVVSSGLFDAINQQIIDLLSSPTSQTTWRIEDYINTNKVLGITALLAVINVVISTALGTLTAFLYNLSANILGGLELTLAED
nr:DUF3566 domain-containing protein [Propionicimonas sp.]